MAGHKYVSSTESYLVNRRSIEAKTLLQKRDKIILGLVIFQALKREEIDNLELHHLNMDEASIYIKATKKTNARTLDLHSLQMAHLMSYLYEYRPQLWIERKRVHPLEQDESQYLFFSIGKGKSLTNAMQFMSRALKENYSKFKTLTQLKESRMAVWVTEHGVRKAQYLSGIRYSSSMLRYKSSDIEKLKQKLSIVHPLERLKL